MAMQIARRLDKLEQVVDREESSKIEVTVLAEAEAEEAERQYILTMCRAALGLCEPDQTIFVSNKIQELEEKFNFPHLSREYAEQLIAENQIEK